MKIATPKYGDIIAPCFEAAGQFEIAEIDCQNMTSCQTIQGLPGEGYRQVRILQIHSVEILICNGIKNFYRDMLGAMGIVVISGQSGKVADILSQFIAGTLPIPANNVKAATFSEEIPHDILIKWTRDFFECNGYTVTNGPGPDAPLIDLVAETGCPRCGRPIKVAICCGAHTYRSDLEIREFHSSTPDSYHARVYVHPSSQPIVNCCDEYGIEHLDPNMDAPAPETPEELSIPILKKSIRGHEQLRGWGG